MKLPLQISSIGLCCLNTAAFVRPLLTTTTATTTTRPPLASSFVRRANPGWTTQGIFQALTIEIDLSNADQSNSTSFRPDANHEECLPAHMLELPRHSHEGVNSILTETEDLIRSMHKHSKKIDHNNVYRPTKKTGGAHDTIFANTYVDLGKVDTVGFDYDYTLVTYKEELLELIYDMALKRLVNDRQYPVELLDAGLKFDPFFSIRGTCEPSASFVSVQFCLQRSM